MFISPTSGIKAYGSVGQKRQGLRDSFCSWSGNEVCVLKPFRKWSRAGPFHSWSRDGILRQRCGARFPWRIKDVQD